MKIPVGLQMYTLRSVKEYDLLGRLEKVAETGYAGVEFAGFENVEASRLKDTLDRLNIKSIGCHAGYGELADGLDKLIDYNLEIGSKYITLAWAKFETMEQVKELAAFLNKAGEKCKKKDLQLCYHNHNHEFDTLDGQYLLDLLWKETDPELVKAELDLYWVQFAGVEPIGYMKKVGKRCVLVHQKDMKAGEKKEMCEVGNGIMDIAGIIKASEEIGADWYIVEQDVCKDNPPLTAVKISYDNIARIGG